MGCGAVCGIQQPSSNKYAIYSQAKILQLFPKIKICKPLLTQHALTRFSEVIRSPNNQYILKMGERVGTDEEIEPAVMDKWRIILYGLDKDEETYKKSLSFQVRNEKQQVTNSEKNLPNNSALIQNKSYHQLKPDMQYHECFVQIEKDLNRTFQFKQEKKKIFENILKRISNYFPSMGYTQGVNFVVGYLLIIGYSEPDTFWMFSHMALNQRYLILGLYQDDFPLAYIYTCIFKNMLRRLDPSLQGHLYDKLRLDESIWIFKWFITYYIYSFPFNTIKYLWNLVIQLGSIALVYYALALVMHIRSHLLAIDDPCDISMFLQELKETNRFNEIIKINEVVLKVYEMQLISSDFEGVAHLKPSFYRDYHERLHQLILTSEGLGRDHKQTRFIDLEPLSGLVQGWYQKIMTERARFQWNSVEKERNTNLPQMLMNQYLDLEKSIHFLQQKVLQNQSAKSSRQPAKVQDNYFGDLIHQVPFDISLTDNPHRNYQAEIIEQQYRSRNLTKMSYDMEQEINEVDEESDSHQDIDVVSSQNIYAPHLQDKPRESIVVEDDISDHVRKQGPSFNLKVNTIVGQVDARKRMSKDSTLKANNLKLGDQKRTGLALAAQNILCNLSVTNSQYSSNSSNKNASIRPRKHKENNIFRYNKNGKVRTEEVSQPQMDPSSSRDSSIDHHTDKESFSGMTHREDHSMDRPSIVLNDRKSQLEFMINSHGPQKIPTLPNASKELTSQIEIFRGDNLFKKKKKLDKRNSNVISVNQTMGKGREELECYSKRTINERNKNSPSQEESIDAILYTLSSRKASQQHQKQIDAMIYQIESIK